MKKKKRKQIRGRRKQWVINHKFKASFTLDSDRVCVVNPLDENPLGKTNIDKGLQYQHSGVKVSGEKLSVGLVFWTVDRENVYDCKNDTMIIYPEMSSNDIVHYSLGQDLDMYQNTLLDLYHNVFY